MALENELGIFLARGNYLDHSIGAAHCQISALTEVLEAFNRAFINGNALFLEHVGYDDN